MISTSSRDPCFALIVDPWVGERGVTKQVGIKMFVSPVFLLIIAFTVISFGVILPEFRVAVYALRFCLIQAMQFGSQSFELYLVIPLLLV